MARVSHESHLVHRLAHNGDVAAGQLAVFQGGPSRTGGKAPISGFIRVDPSRRRKNSQLAAARRGCVENGPAAVRRPLDRLRIDLDMRPLNASPARTALPAAHFE